MTAIGHGMAPRRESNLEHRRSPGPTRDEVDATTDRGTPSIKGKPDVQASSRMKDCVGEVKVTSGPPTVARNLHDNRAQQCRPLGPTRGMGTTVCDASGSDAVPALLAPKGLLAQDSPHGLPWTDQQGRRARFQGCCIAVPWRRGRQAVRVSRAALQRGIENGDDAFARCEKLLEFSSNVSHFFGLQGGRQR